MLTLGFIFFNAGMVAAPSKHGIIISVNLNPA